jgi:hypothetical protein
MVSSKNSYSFIQESYDLKRKEVNKVSKHPDLTLNAMMTSTLQALS